MTHNHLPIITYHAIGDIPSPLWTSIDVFDAQLKTFAQCGYHTISLSDILARLHQHQPLPEKAFTITFDDGYDSVYKDALPRLQHYGFQATVFVISDYCGCTNQWIGQPKSVPIAPLLTWSQAKKLIAAGWEIGCHTRSHCSLPTVSLQRAIEEITISQQTIEARLDQPIRIFAYPYGATNPSITQIVQQHFDGAVGTQLGLVQPNTNPYLLNRIDAYYLSPQWIPRASTLLFQQYLNLRQLLRSLRRSINPDWQPVSDALDNACSKNS